jgi:hypothetical protein
MITIKNGGSNSRVCSRARIADICRAVLLFSLLEEIVVFDERGDVIYKKIRMHNQT